MSVEIYLLQKVHFVKSTFVSRARDMNDVNWEKSSSGCESCHGLMDRCIWESSRELSVESESHHDDVWKRPLRCWGERYNHTHSLTLRTLVFFNLFILVTFPAFIRQLHDFNFRSDSSKYLLKVLCGATVYFQINEWLKDRSDHDVFRL